MGHSTKEHLKELLASFDTAMLITRDGDLDHARPMAIADIEGANTLWFVTAQPSPKTDELLRDVRVSATFQSSSRFVALSGVGEIVTDRSKIDALWKPAWKTWFPEGKDDPSLALIKVVVSDAEFWDNAGLKGVKYAFAAAKAFVTGDRVVPADDQHGRVKNGEVPSSRHG